MKSYTYRSLPDEAKPKARCYICLVLLASFVSLFFIIFALIGFPILFQDLVNKQVVLTNGTLNFEQWLNPTPKIYKVVTVHNVTNLEEVRMGLAPNVSSIGPYYFREYREKTDVIVANTYNIFYKEKKYYIFDNETTNKDRATPLDPAKDKFYTINLAWVGVVYNMTCSGGVSPTEKIIIEAAATKLKDDTLFTNRTVNEIIFGYKDPLLDVLKTFIPGLPTTVQCVYNMSSRDMNNFSVIHNGGDNSSLLGAYSQWQGYHKLPYWESDEANTLNGTEGLFFAPNLQPNKSVTTFVDDLFRSNPMEYIGEEEVLGITSYKYQIPMYVLKNATQNPLNSGFNSYGPSGLMNLTAAVNAPVMASKPSFLDAESWLIDEVVGLDPQNRNMDTNIWIEPHTGVLTKAMKQLQVNVMIEQSDWHGMMSLRKKPRFIPLATIVETGGLDKDLADTLKHKVYRPRKIGYGLLYGLFGFFTLLTVVFVAVLGHHVIRNQGDVTRPLIPNGQKENIYS